MEIGAFEEQIDDPQLLALCREISGNTEIINLSRVCERYGTNPEDVRKAWQRFKMPIGTMPSANASPLTKSGLKGAMLSSGIPPYWKKPTGCFWSASRTAPGHSPMGTSCSSTR